MEDSVWYAIESRVRKLVKDIIEPTIRRVQDSKEANEKLIRKDEISTERIDSLEVQFAQTSQRIDNLNSFSSKIIESEANLKVLEQRITGNIDKIYQKISSIDVNIHNLTEKTTVLDNQRILIEENASGLEQNVLMIKNNTDVYLNETKEKNEKRFENVETNIRNIESNIKQIYKKIENISNDLSETDYLAKKSERLTMDHSDKLVNISKIIQQTKRELQENIEKVRISMIAQNKEQGDSVKKVMRYLENDYKIAMNIAMIEHIYSSITDPKALHSLAHHEKEKIAEWSSHSLQSTLKESLEKSRSRCQSIIDTPLPQEPSKKKKYSRHSSKESLKKSLSKEGLKSQSVLKSPPPELQNEENVDSEPNETNDIVSNDFLGHSLTINNPKIQPSPRSIYAEPIYVQNDYDDIEMIDYMPYIQELRQIMVEFKNEYQNEISNIYKNAQNIKNDLEKKIDETHSKQETFIENTLKKNQEMQLLFSEATHECNMVSNLRKRDLSDINKTIADLSQKQQDYLEENSKLEEDIQEILKKINSLMEVCKINIYLQQQDEIDRESISLMGYKDQSKPPLKNNMKKQVVSIDKTCQSCTGQSSIVLSAFKMACLAYTPSSVFYSKQVFSRKELIDIQKRIVEGMTENALNNSLTQAVEEKKKVRAKSAFNVRRFRPSSVPMSAKPTSNFDIYSSIGSDLPNLSKKF